MDFTETKYAKNKNESIGLIIENNMTSVNPTVFTMILIYNVRPSLSCIFLRGELKTSVNKPTIQYEH